MKLYKDNPLFFSFLFPMLTDCILTLAGQDSSYWINFQSANEMSPAYFFMAVHPMLYIIGGIIWFIGLYWLFLRLKPPFNLIISCAFIAGNTWGSSTWITKMMRETGILVSANRSSILSSWTIMIIYIIFIAIIAGISFNQYFINIKNDK